MDSTRPTTGIPDPDDPGRWLVRPWPVHADFATIVRHFMITYVTRLMGDTSAARQLAYFEGYQAALLATSTGEPLRNELLRCVADCVAACRAREATGGNARPLRRIVSSSVPRRQAS